MSSIENCRICESESITIICTEIRGNIPCDVLKCHSCGLVFLPSEYFDTNRLKKQYEKEYTYRPTLDKLLDTEHDPYRKRVRRILTYLDRNETKLLEIGAGEGYFINTTAINSH